MPMKRIKRASEVAVVCVRHPCVGFCDWDPRVGRSLIAQGAHCLARSGLSRWLEGWEGDKPKIFNQNDPLAFHKGELHHSDVGGPGDLWSWGALSYMCPLCHGFCINFAHLHNMDLIGSDAKLSVQNQFKALRIQPNVNYSLDSWVLCDSTICTKNKYSKICNCFVFVCVSRVKIT